MKPKICLVCDVPNWAFDIIAKRVRSELSDSFDFDITYFDMREKPEEFFEFLEGLKDYDLIHFFWRKTLLLMEDETFISKVNSKYGDVEEYIKSISSKISTSVNDFMFLSPDEINMCKNIFNKYSKSYYVICKPLLEKYSNISEYKAPWGVVHDMFDSKIMKPSNLERFENFDRSLVIGWVGNSKFSYGTDLKGFHTIIKPVIQELTEQGLKIEEFYADRNVTWRSHEEMPEYYSHVDVCLSTSITEGTPLPLLEAMSCGVPVITTDVGVAREALGTKEQEFILGKRSDEEQDKIIRDLLKEKITLLYQNRSLLKELSNENIESINKYDGGRIAKEFKTYFENCLKK